MIEDSYGNIGYTEEEVCNELLRNPSMDLTSIFLINSNYYTANTETYFDLPAPKRWEDRKEINHKELQNKWKMPEEYYNLDIENYLYSKCDTIKEVERVQYELELYYEFGLMNLLRYLKYIKDVADKNKIVWGVGRGSSCSSYCLYLMRIHRVNSLNFGLNIEEFLREN